MCACLRILLCLPASKYAFCWWSSDVWKIIWTVHRWCLFKLLPLVTPGDTELNDNFVSPMYEYDWQWTSNHNNFQQLIYETDLTQSVSRLLLFLRDFALYYTISCKLYRFQLKTVFLIQNQQSTSSSSISTESFSLYHTCGFLWEIYFSPDLFLSITLFTKYSNFKTSVIFLPDFIISDEQIQWFA